MAESKRKAREKRAVGADPLAGLDNVRLAGLLGAREGRAKAEPGPAQPEPKRRKRRGPGVRGSAQVEELELELGGPRAPLLPDPASRTRPPRGRANGSVGPKTRRSTGRPEAVPPSAVVPPPVSVPPPTAEEAESAFGSKRETRYVYSRYGNPTVSVFEERLRQLEGAEACCGTASGMAAVFASLMCQLRAGDRSLDEFLAMVDQHIERTGIDAPGAPERAPPSPAAIQSPARLDIRSERIGSVIWATGFRPDFSFLKAPAFDRKGRLRHHGGIVDVPGLYVLGLNFMRRRKSSFIHGAEDDVRDLGEHLLAGLRRQPARISRIA